MAGKRAGLQCACVNLVRVPVSVTRAGTQPEPCGSSVTRNPGTGGAGGGTPVTRDVLDQTLLDRNKPGEVTSSLSQGCDSDAWLRSWCPNKRPEFRAVLPGGHWWLWVLGSSSTSSCGLQVGCRSRVVRSCTHPAPRDAAVQLSQCRREESQLSNRFC